MQSNKFSINCKQQDVLALFGSNKKAGIETRIKYQNRGLYHKNIDENWTPIFDVKRSFI